MAVPRFNVFSKTMKLSLPGSKHDSFKMNAALTVESVDEILTFE